MENNLSKEEMLNVISTSIKNIEDKTFNVYFYVYDTQGYSNGSLEYIYQTAYTLKELGYNVTMLHNEENFVGVSDWLGEKYAAIPHKNINTDNVPISASDFLFIPEVFASIMGQTKKLPCKRVLIMQNHRFLCEFFQVGVTPFNYGISECITTSEYNEMMLDTYFGGMKTHIVKPCLKNMFRPNDMAKDLIVNIISDNKMDENRIIKPFYWEFPVYKWVSFRDLRGLSEETFAEGLRSGVVTICLNSNPSVGYNLMEAVRCGSIVLAKVPERPLEWMLDENGDLISGIIWFDDIEKVPAMLASIVRTWTLDEIDDELIKDISDLGEKLHEEFGEETNKKNIESVYTEIFNNRIKEFSEVKGMVKNNTLK